MKVSFNIPTKTEPKKLADDDFFSEIQRNFEY